MFKRSNHKHLNRPTRQERQLQQLGQPLEKRWVSDAELAARRRAEKRGLSGELWSVWWLRLHGWRIVAQRVKLRGGEVDIIARRAGVLAFVEVKRRGSQAERDVAIDKHRLRRVARVAEYLAHRYARDGEDVRIDVLLFAPWSLPRHLTNVWQL